MTRAITKIGNSQGLMLDAALMDRARVKVGDRVSIPGSSGAQAWWGGRRTGN